MAWITHWETKIVTVQPRVEEDKTHLDEVLKELWEPFAVTWNGVVFHYHLRRTVTINDRKL